MEKIPAVTLHLGDRVNPELIVDGDERPLPAGVVTDLVEASTTRGDRLTVVTLDNGWTLAYSLHEEVWATRY